MSTKKKNVPVLVRPDHEFKKDNMEIRYKEFNEGTNLHWHDYYELEVIVGGEGFYYVNGVKHALTRGNAYLATPVDFHLIKGDFKLYNVAFSDAMVSDAVINQIAVLPAATVISFEEQEFVFIERALEALMAEFDGSSSLREEAMRGLLDFILARHLRKIEPETGDLNRSDIAVLRVVSYIKFNFKKKLTLAEAAKAVYLTPNYVGEIFAKKMGISFNAYLMQTRLNYAKNLLQRGTYTIEEVAYNSGFGSQTYFSDCFKKQFGYTPTAVKRKAVSESADDSKDNE